MDAADLADATLTIRLRIEGGPTATGPWALMAGGDEWRGNTIGKSGQPVAPAVSYATSSAQPAFYRVTVDLPRTVPIGLDVAAG